MPRRSLPLIALLPAWLLAWLLAAPLRAQPQPAQEDPFQTNVRPTEPLSPQEERAALRVPPGFEVQLVAAEPEILKPMNLAFDERGRLWVSDSTEYPYAAPLDRPGRDSIKILEDTDGDGQADRITTFADGLNIPIGVLPFGDGAIVFSIPNIWYLRDTDGDGRADRREKLFGPMGFERDTHGLNNAFRRGFDDWIYACHGFNNETRVQGRDGHLVHMKSGNTYRMRADGSRIEQFTWGQVNPFGMTIDAWGNLFTADCHSKPIYQLLRGGYYPSFGAPHDGLGFVPPMMNHLHGSTAIAGVAFYSGRNFPAEYRGNLYSGNVMTSRVNRNLMEYHGSTILARELPDFVVSEDPWFRPVDVQVGPDGALYVADFYNRIIGHYEVPLAHPGRDRHRGRIWRIVYRGDDPGSRPAEMPRALSEMTDEQRIAELGDESLARRLAATNYLVDTAGDATLDRLLQSLQSGGGASSTGPLRAHGLWVLHRRGRLPAELLAEAAADGDRLVATHAMKILADMPQWSDAQRGLVLRGLEHSGAFVRRAAADALALHPDPRNLKPLLSVLGQVAADDPLLRYTIRIALRDNLRTAEAWAALPDDARQGEQAGQIAELCLAIPNEAAARFLLDYLRRQEAPREQVAEYVRHAARYIPAAEASTLAELVRRRFAGDLDFQLQLLESLVSGVEQRGGQLDQPLSAWAAELSAALLATIDDQALAWSNLPLAGMAPADNPWALQQRPCSDGQPADFLCSLPHGERLTGVLRSRPFTIPQRLTFYTAGHLGFPNEPLVPKNFIRLRDARTHALLREARPPRHDTARQVEWELGELAGRQGYLELVDGDDRPAYAWLAVGRFEPPVVGLPPLAPRDVTERLRGAGRLIGRFRLEQLDERLLGLLSSPALVEPAAIEAVAAALVQREPSGLLAAVTPLLGDAAVPESLRRQVIEAVVQRDEAVTGKALSEALRAAPSRWQQLLAQALAGDQRHSQLLLQLVDRGQASPRLLRDPTVVARLTAVHGAAINARLEMLTAGIPAASEERQQLIAERRRAFARSTPSADEGRRMFQQHCAACHQLAGQGPLIGPQLDGIGNRGADRLIEDILDPNRNVDVAFSTTTLALASGKVLSGLFRREEGSQLVFVDSLGKEFTVAADQIDEQAKVRLSLMPENLADRMQEQEFYSLLVFLLEQRAEYDGKPPEERGEEG